MGVMERVIPGLLGDSTSRDWADITFEEAWAETNAVLDWVVEAAESAGQPQIFSVLSEASQAIDPASPSAAVLRNEVPLDGDDAANAFLTAVLLSTTVMAAYLSDRSLADVVKHGVNGLGGAARLTDDEILTGRSLHVMVLLCGPSDDALAQFLTPILDELTPIQQTDMEFGFVFDASRMFATMLLPDQIRTTLAATALGVSGDHVAVRRMLNVAGDSRV